jgi:hypothetical protein
VLRQPVGPAAVTTIPVGIFQSFGTGVADRHIATKCCHDPIVTRLGKINSGWSRRSGRLARNFRLSSASDDQVGGFHARLHEKRTIKKR